MRIHRVCLLLVLAGLAVQSGGCLLVAAGAGAAGTVAYMKGDLETEEPYGLDTVYTATREAMKQLQLSVLEGRAEKDALSATLVARDADDKRVTVRLKARSEQSTEVSIRIGTFGDQTKSQMIYNRIRQNLKVVAPAPAPMAATGAAQSLPSNSPPVPPLPAQELPVSSSPPPSAPPAQPPADSSAAPPVTSPPAPQ